jgi:hypothetical protein
MLYTLLTTPYLYISLAYFSTINLLIVLSQENDKIPGQSISFRLRQASSLPKHNWKLYNHYEHHPQYHLIIQALSMWSQYRPEHIVYNCRQGMVSPINRYIIEIRSCILWILGLKNYRRPQHKAARFSPFYAFDVFSMQGSPINSHTARSTRIHIRNTFDIWNPEDLEGFLRKAHLFFADSKVTRLN